MGGRFSGTWIRLGGKRCTDTLRALDIRRLRRDGAVPLPPSPHLWWQGSLLCLEWTPQPYGGFRAWLVCPGCTRRSGLLYQFQSTWACRRCLGLVYRSTQCAPLSRLYRKSHKLRDRLGISWNLTEVVRPSHKPKGMQWRTFWRVYQEEQQVRCAIMQALDAERARWKVRRSLCDDSRARVAR